MQINIIGARQRSSILRENVRRRKRLAVFTLPVLVETALSYLKGAPFLAKGSFCQRLRRICFFARAFGICTFGPFFGRDFFAFSCLCGCDFFTYSRFSFVRKERFGFEMVFSSMAFFLCGIFSLIIINSSSGKVSIFPNIFDLAYRSFDRICNIYISYTCKGYYTIPIGAAKVLFHSKSRFGIENMRN